MKFTPNSLFQLSIELQAASKFTEAEDALICAVWMEKKKIPELNYIGPFGEIKKDYHRGMTVKIPKGTYVSRPTHPKERNFVAGRTYSVTLHDVYTGYVNREKVIQPHLLWAGTGGYWCEADPNIIC